MNIISNIYRQGRGGFPMRIMRMALVLMGAAWLLSVGGVSVAVALDPTVGISGFAKMIYGEPVTE